MSIPPAASAAPVLTENRLAPSITTSPPSILMRPPSGADDEELRRNALLAGADAHGPSRATAGPAADDRHLPGAALRRHGQTPSRPGPRESARWRRTWRPAAIVAGAEAQGGALRQDQEAAVDLEPPDIGAQEPERLRLRHLSVLPAVSSALNTAPSAKSQLVGGAGVERALHVESRVRAEQDAGRVEQVEVGAGDRRGERAVDRGALAAGDPADDVRSRPGR